MGNFSVNHGEMEKVVKEVEKYKKSLKLMDEALLGIRNEAQKGKGKAMKKLVERTNKLRDSVDEVRWELEDVQSIFGDYRKDMAEIFWSVNFNKPVVLDLRNFKQNKEAIYSACERVWDLGEEQFGYIIKNNNDPGIGYDEDVKGKLRRNGIKIELARAEFNKSKATFMEKLRMLDKAYEKAVKYQEKDEYYSRKAHRFTKEYPGTWTAYNKDFGSLTDLLKKLVALWLANAFRMVQVLALLLHVAVENSSDAVAYKGTEADDLDPPDAMKEFAGKLYDLFYPKEPEISVEDIVKEACGGTGSVSQGDALRIRRYLERKGYDEETRRKIINEIYPIEAKEIQDYWNQIGRYFAGCWWQDEEKIKKAYEMLKLEITLYGYIDIRKEATEGTGPSSRYKVYVIQKLFGATESGAWDEGTVNQIEIILSKINKDARETDYRLDGETLDFLWVEYQNKSGKGLTILADYFSDVTCAGVDEVRRPKGTTTHDKEWGTIEAYWNNTDGYFDGYWWQDEEKVRQAYKMLTQEIQLTGKLDLYEIGMEHDATYPSKKLMVIQALFGAQRDGCWNESLLSKMEAAFSKYGIDIQEKGYVLTKEELAIAMLEYQNIPFKKWTNFLEQNPWVAESMNVMALAVVAYAQSSGKSQDSEGKKTKEKKKSKTAGKTGSSKGGKTSVQHAVGSANQAQSVLDGIDLKYFNAESRFGKGFYVGGEGKTIDAELAEHGNTAKFAISYDMNLSGQKVLNLTNPKVAMKWDYTPGLTSTDACKNIGALARKQGYSVIIFQSYRGDGINYVIYSNFDNILTSRIVTPIE